MSGTFCTSLNAACAAQAGGATGAAAQWVNRYGMLHRKRPCRGRGETDHNQIEARPPTGGYIAQVTGMVTPQTAHMLARVSALVSAQRQQNAAREKAVFW